MSKIIRKTYPIAAVILFVSGFVVLALSTISAGPGNQRLRAARSTVLPQAPDAAPGSGTLNPAGPNVIWDGTATGGSSEEGETSCVEGVNCDTFLLTLSGTPANWVGKTARVTISWADPNGLGNDYDVYIHKGNTNSGPLVGSSAAGGPGPEIVDLDPNNPAIGTGVFSVHVIYWLVVPDQYHAVASAVGGAPTPTPTPTPSPTPVAGAPRYFNYVSPPGVGDDAGEPSLGINWKSELSFSNNNIVTGNPNPTIPNGGTSTYYGGFLSYMLKITFDDCPSPANATWDQKPVTLPATTRGFGDPILFTDHGWPAYPGMPASLGTGRTFVCQLEGLTPAGSTIEYTDNDGTTFSPSQGGGPSCVDHETIGGGPFHLPLPPQLPSPAPYPNAVYYASQCISDATSELSVDGGITFPIQTVMFTAADCAGLHGHLKVGPDGTAFVPDKACASLAVPLLNGGEASVAVSENNGATWAIRSIPGATSSGNDDPSVGVATDSNTIFLGYQAADGHARIAVSHNKGVNWSVPFDVGAQLGIQNCAFPEVVAGDGEQNGPNTSRAAFAFFGSTTGGDGSQPAFPGVWYLYIASTFDGGQTWTTVNVTPGDPIQRGGICGSGACRNLLDFFDASIDKEGRVLIGGEDGCIGGCVNGTTNSFTAKAFITRQSGGKRMFRQFDPVEPARPGAPLATAVLNGAQIQLSWLTPDNGGLAISAYKIYRRQGTIGAFTLLATTTQTNYVDTTFNPSTSVAKNYRVTAVNAIGEGPYCHDITTAAPPPTPCDLPYGLLVINDLNPNGTDNDPVGGNVPVDGSVNVRQLWIAEPGNLVNKLVFTMIVAPSHLSSPPPNSQWFIVWNRQAPDANFDRWYVAMRTDATGVPSFEYGKFGVALDPTNPNQNANTPVFVGAADSGSYDIVTGVIKITLSDSKAENVVAGNTLGGLNVRTYFNRPDPGQRSQNNASDITADSSYTLVGNAFCAPAVDLVSANSRKTHGGTAGTFDVKLFPLVPAGTVGIECRQGQGASLNNHQVVFLFAAPVTLASATCGGNAATTSTSGNEVTVNCTGVPNAQTTTITLLGVTTGGAPTNISVPMGLLLGDVNSSRRVDGTDVSLVRQQNFQTLTQDPPTFREDINTSGRIDGTDVSLARQQNFTVLPP